MTTDTDPTPRRHFLKGALAASALAASPLVSRLAVSAESTHDLLIIGAGNAGLAAAVFAAKGGARVVLVEAANVPGGTLMMSAGQMSAAGTAVQQQRGIEDSADLHYEDVMRISRNTADSMLVRMAVDGAASTFDWLMSQGFPMLPDHPVTGLAHEPYSVPRYYWGERNGHSVLAVLIEALRPELERGQARLHLATRAVGLDTGRDGRIVAVRCREADGTEHGIAARHVLLACGGYAANSALFEELCGYRDYGDGSYPFSQGDGIRLGQSVGGYVRGRENYLCNFGAVLENDNFPAKRFARFDTYPERRPPWEIYVNTRGERFVREDEPSVDRREHALLAQPELRYWIVFDEAILDQAPVGLMGFSRESLRGLFDTHPMFLRADSLTQLAQQAGIEAAGLERSVADYNAGVNRGEDPLGRQHLPRRIEAGPFYAIRMQGYSVTSTVGLAVDDQLRVLRGDGQSIPNLYAAGELLGSGQLMGKAFCGGMMVTPALTFGRMIGQRIAQEVV